MNEYLELIRQFNRNPTLCNWFQLFAYDTWRRIEFARNQEGLKIFETTITQNILYEFAVYKELYKLPIKMYEALDERSNGNDIEFEFIHNNKRLCLPMQAKIIYSNGTYPRMEHGSQIESLIDYAADKSGYPLYILYNYYATGDAQFYNRNECEINYNIQQYGISLVSAYHLRDVYYNQRENRNGNPAWVIPHFTDLHPDVAIPWFKLVCCDNIKRPSKVLDLFHQNVSKQKIHSIKYTPLETDEHVLSSWKLLNLEKFVGEYSFHRKEFVEKAGARTEKNSNYNKKFNPKYKIEIQLL